MRLNSYLEQAAEPDASFARRIGVSPQALSRYKLGQRRPEWDVLERIARETDGAVTPNDFIDLAKRPAPSPAEAAP